MRYNVQLVIYRACPWNSYWNISTKAGCQRLIFGTFRDSIAAPIILVKVATSAYRMNDSILRFLLKDTTIESTLAYKEIIRTFGSWSISWKRKRNAFKTYVSSGHPAHRRKRTREQRLFKVELIRCFNVILITLSVHLNFSMDYLLLWQEKSNLIWTAVRSHQVTDIDLSSLSFFRPSFNKLTVNRSRVKKSIRTFEWNSSKILSLFFLVDILIFRHFDISLF